MTPKMPSDTLHAIANHAFFTDHVSFLVKEQTTLADEIEDQYADLWDPLQALLHFNVKAIPARSIHPADAKRLQQVKSFLQEHYLDPVLSLGLLCRRFGLNEFKLKRGFKQLFGYTVFGYVQEMRMKTARQILAEGRMNVNEVADHLGYSSPNHFSTAFKKMYGIPPAKLKSFSFNFFSTPKENRPE
ncbi:helix-turn-helix domain-containing protein [Chitinophaga sp. SYP-B3965]|uniref:helix-turn-helix transcriptional regulator n=1 Tax=Chitinophaga sp. SYP-B3965 TaxID=2663120 RepID=UPI00129A00F9|nr:AraC family transcriptional regulator [Chitinophaga sp. SYP-B3965]MRG47823.1 helix-turn-helix domain-containing protein [Chitinophaga sp. SYP-B3965]